MTNLNKPVRRRGTVPVHELGRKRVVVMLEPGDTLAIRQENRRRWYRATFAELYRLLVQKTAYSEARAFSKRVSELVKAGNNRRTAKMLARQEQKNKPNTETT